MGDVRNKLRKQKESEATRKMQAQLRGPPAPPFVPHCAGCGLKGLHNLNAGGELIRIIFVSPKGPSDEGEFVCENCLEARTGFNPDDLL